MPDWLIKTVSAAIVGQTISLGVLAIWLLTRVRSFFSDDWPSFKVTFQRVETVVNEIKIDIVKLISSDVEHSRRLERVESRQDQQADRLSTVERAVYRMEGGQRPHDR